MKINCLFFHLCCHSGFKELLEFKKEWEKENNKELNIKAITYFNVRDLGYPEKYNFDLEDLRNNSFIVFEDDNKIIKI